MTRFLPILLLLVLSGCAPSIDDGLEQARALSEQERFEEMIPLLTRMHYEAPSHPEVNHLYGLALLRTENSGMAVWPLRIAANTPGREVESGLLLAQALAQGSVPVGSIAAIDRVLALAPERLDAWTLRARVNQSLQRFDDALADCDRILESEPNRADAVICQIESLMALERFQEADDALLRATERIEGLPGARTRMRSRFCRLSARLQHEKGDLALAAERWSACVEAHPVHPELIPEATRFFDAAEEPERATKILESAVSTAPARLDLVAALADRYRDGGRPAEAESLLRSATDQPGIAAPAWLALAEHHRGRDEFARAIEATERAFAGETAIPALHLAQHADDLIQAREFERARAIIDSLPDHPMVDFLLGRARLLQGDPEGALEAFEQGLLLWPGNATARFLAGEAAERLGDMDRAIAEYRDSVRADVTRTDAVFRLVRIHEAEGAYAPCFIALGHRLKDRPDDVEARIAALRVALKAGRPDIVDESLDALSELDGQRATYVVERAAVERLTGGPQAAVDSIRESGLDLTDPTNADALGALALYLAQAGDAKGALATVDGILEENASSAQLHEIHAAAQLAAGRGTNAARQALERSIELDAERPTALAGLAGLLAAGGQHASAVDLFDRADALDPDEPSYAWGAIEAISALGRDAELDDRLAYIIEAHPLHVAALSLQATRALARDSVEEAESIVTRALRFGGGPSVAILRARTLMARQDSDRARELLLRVEAAGPRQPSALYQLGNAFEEIDEPDRARASWRKALSAGDFPEAERARKALERTRADDG